MTSPLATVVDRDELFVRARGGHEIEYAGHHFFPVLLVASRVPRRGRAVMAQRRPGRGEISECASAFRLGRERLDGPSEARTIGGLRRDGDRCRESSTGSQVSCC